MNNRPLEDLLDWYIASGADEAIGDEPVDRFAAAAPGPVATAIEPAIVRQAPRTKPKALQSATVAAAQEEADRAQTVDELRQIVAAFDGCPLKATATNTVFADGNPASGIMFIGEAPGADEDRIGRPFVGVSGQLLDRMIRTIGLDRSSAYITNVIFWRPPGNRKPTDAEVAICRPFVMRHIELIAPHLVVIVGGTASGALLPGSEGITKLRGRWLHLSTASQSTPVQTMAIYHPSFLLRSPERKRESWLDLLKIDSFLKKRNNIDK